MLLSAAAGSAAPDAASAAPLLTATQDTASAAGQTGVAQSSSPASTGPTSNSGAELQLLAWLAGTSTPGAADMQTAVSGDASADSTAADGSPGSSPGGPLSPLLPDPAQSANAALALAAPPHTAAAAHTANAVLQAPVGTSAWVEQLGAQLTWMANRGIESASLHVSPADLGPIEVRIAVHGRDASVWFGAAHAGTRAALEQALPQLHNLFAAQGLALSDAGVFREPPRQSARRATAPSTPAIAALRDEPARTADPRSIGSLGLLDLYA